MQKENILEDLESENLEYETTEEFLVDLKKEFRGRDKEVVKVTELKRLEQEEKIIEEFVQKFQRESGYKEKLLIKNSCRI